jgi:apolipoprotein N-acyltransferase
MKLNNIHIKLAGLSILTGCLLTLSWPPIGLFPLVFVGFVPLFFIHHLIIQNKLSATWAFLYGFSTFLLFNIGTTWWVWNASAGGAVMAFILNSLLMNMPFMFLHQLAKKHQTSLKLWPFIWAWIAFEYFHLRWDATWPWLTLGNVFAQTPWLVQWYEYTGTVGGSLWILWVNKKLFQWLVLYKPLSKQQRFKSAFNLAFLGVFTPAFLSYYILDEYQRKQESYTAITANVMVVQPNIDPYKEKFNSMSDYEQTLKMLNIADKNMDSTVQLIAFPETALVGNLNERDLANEESIKLIRQFMSKYPTVNIITGADSYKEYLQGEKPSNTAREYNPGQYYDAYNAAYFLQPNSPEIDIYHKSILVPGVERLPFSSVLKHVEQYAIDLGGTTGSLGVDEAPHNFTANTMLKAAPIICYESVFGEYVTEYVKRGATFLCIITNDGWWGNTPGYKQHLQYASLRAIETRRYVVRSANTGISAFFDDKGNLLQKTNWWEPAALKQNIRLNTDQTFYVKNGDMIGEYAILFAAYFLLGLIIKRKSAFMP